MQIFQTWVFLLGLGFSVPAFGEAAAVSTLGVGFRKLDYIPAKRSATDVTASEQESPSFLGAVLCQEVSGGFRPGLEMSAGGCAQLGGEKSFAVATGLFATIVYLPGLARRDITSDDGVRLTAKRGLDFLFLGQVGLTKVTHAIEKDDSTSSAGGLGSVDESNRTLTSDVIEFGAGVGLRGKINARLTWGVQAKALVGVILSKSTSGKSYSSVVGPTLNYLF